MSRKTFDHSPGFVDFGPTYQNCHDKHDECSKRAIPKPPSS
jgi:hypothetical protein